MSTGRVMLFIRRVSFQAKDYQSIERREKRYLTWQMPQKIQRKGRESASIVLCEYWCRLGKKKKRLSVSIQFCLILIYAYAIIESISWSLFISLQEFVTLLLPHFAHCQKISWVVFIFHLYDEVLKVGTSTTYFHSKLFFLYSQLDEHDEHHADAMEISWPC